LKKLRNNSVFSVAIWNMKKRLSMNLLFALSIGLCSNLFATDAPNLSTPYLSPEAEAKTFRLPEGYRLELVLSEPVIKEPVVSVFDGNGRMFVAEMRSYMQDIDGRDELTPHGRVSLHWSSKGDGVYDKHTVFIDHLVLPRMILPLADGLLVNETDTEDLWLYRDTDGDGVADKKELFYAGGARGGNLEHQQSGLIWDRDNWLYEAMNSYRLRLQGTNVIREPTPPNSGQWGLSQDDYGKTWFVNAGGELGPVNFQQPIVYGAFNANGQFSPDFMEVWPLVGLADVQGGTIRFRPQNKTLNHLTACCGPDIFRGDRLPADLRGDLLFGEPVGRLIRRAKIEVKDGVTSLRNAYDKSEFILSTDPNFRPINMVTAPDGTLYIVDMYRGIIQEGAWVRPGSYLRRVVEQYQLDKNFGRGRIWRLVHKDFQPGPQPHMQDETPAQLVAHLDHPNGWWRDTAQKLLVLRGDKSVAPALIQMARNHPNHLARIHALWSLEGLDALEPAFVREKLKDEHPQVCIAAIRASETLYKKGDKSLVDDIQLLAKDSDPNVVIQVMMTANLLKWPDTVKLLEAAIADHPADGVKGIATQLIQPGASFAREFSSEQKQLLARGETIYKELCFACHGPDGKGMPMHGAKPGTTMAPPLAGSKTVNGTHDGIMAVLLKGLTGPVNGKTYDALMVPMESNDDAWVAAVASYVRNGFGNGSPLIEAKDVTRMRATLKERMEPWTLSELRTALPQPLRNRKDWKVTASHNSQSASQAIDGDLRTRFDTSTPQVPGMWFQIELPQETTITGIDLNTSFSPRDYPRGYKVELSADGRTAWKSVASGRGTGWLTEIAFPPADAKFIRITQTGSVSGLFWSIHDLQILKPGEFKPLVAKKPEASKFE
jgi:mono/diheme cytochrome c family protein/glucose/arabinose dehydrogenase